MGSRGARRADRLLHRPRPRPRRRVHRATPCAPVAAQPELHHAALAVGGTERSGRE
jgi:hypothetical protein